MKSQNVTVKLSAETLRKVKVIAAERGASISALLTRKLEELVGEAAAYQAAHRRALDWLAHGWHLGETTTRPQSSS